MGRHNIRKIYASPALQAEYHALAEEIRALDSGIAIPPPVHEAALDYMRGLVATLRCGEA
jgi:hypothetical protein